MTFVGPPPTAIDAMGSKSVAKAIMSDAGVPICPGYHGEDQSGAFLEEEAGRVGYPLMIKAVMGGGGKGMRLVTSPEGFRGALEACRREAAAGFADDRVLLERSVRPSLVLPVHVRLPRSMTKKPRRQAVVSRQCCQSGCRALPTYQFSAWWDRG